ncbi:alpha/beta fold hydrolase [Streptococcus loxodontisalivarius]|uniref:Pimeloyl-ACP methyl ester carboxylesterase n=1 Tax=Streptococcus loxodontisalivarius TaxID=1349415 RepID=A0ABS2PTS9_9STRE|nr:alpha/beta hydrolase [Streptococcus loxodontisalivarius]MBM7643439.1 pimeloyl-ACP methyl ester carboxylesterase [Streptococcus loxodontisalivarius]
MSKISRLSVIALSVVLCTACSANKDSQKANESQPQQEKLTPKQQAEEDKAREASGAVDLSKYKAQPIEDYGQKVNVGNGKKMNIYSMGEGTIPIVVIPGQAEISARYGYKNLLDRLGKKYKIYTVEPLGYGLSDTTDKPRTIENITKEIHTALEKVGVKNFYLMAHSLGGMYSLNYAKTYSSDVKGFIGMDTSTPDMEGEVTTSSDKSTFKWAQTIPDVDKSVNEQYFSIGAKHYGNKTLLDEDKHVSENLHKMRKVKFPKGMPAKYFLAKQSDDSIKTRQQEFKDLKDWDQQHIDLSEDPNDVSIEKLDATHLLYQTHYEQMAQSIDEWIQAHEK